MELTESELQGLYALAITAAARASAYIQSHVGQHRKTNTKNAGDTLASQVVTEVDLESQRLILNTLRGSIEEYKLGLLTEESEDDSSRLESDYFWCIDPLDGTLPFIEGTPGYSVSIALVSRKGDPQLGVVHDPVADEVFHASKELGTFMNGDPIPAPSSLGTGNGSGKLTWLMDRSMRSLEIFPRLAHAMKQLATDTGHTGLTIIDHAGAALNGAWVTRNSPAIYFKFPKRAKGGGSLWDFAATACLLKEWGPAATDIFGSPLALNHPGSTFMNERGVLFASHSELGDAIRDIYRQSIP